MNVALFTTDYDDIQMTYRLGVVPLLFNAGVASIDGGELELEYSPTAEFRLDGSLGYLDRVSTDHATAALRSGDADGHGHAHEPTAVHAANGRPIWVFL